MFEMGFWELLLVLLIALVVLGPERLGQAAYWLGQWFSQLKNALNEAQEKPDEAPKRLNTNERQRDENEPYQ